MKVIGIEIDGNKANFCILENKNGVIDDITENFRKIELANDEDCQELREFAEVIHSKFDSLKIDSIAIIRRAKKGSFAASPISFKIEGIIQMYKKIDIKFVAPPTLRAFYKKNIASAKAKYGYQKNACELAEYLLKTE